MAYKFARSFSRMLRSPGMAKTIKDCHALQISTFYAKISPSKIEAGVSKIHTDSKDVSEDGGYSRKTFSDDDDLEVDLVDSSTDGINSTSDLDDCGEEVAPDGGAEIGGAGVQAASFQGVYKAILLGEVGLAPAQKMMRNGHVVTWFSLATGGMRNNRRPFDTETPEEYAQRSIVQWHRVAIYQDRVGMQAMRILRQGSQVYVEGNMETRIFYDPQSNVVKRVKEIAIRRNGRVLFLDQQRNAAAMKDKKFR